MMAAQNFMKFGAALAPDFTVIIPDRRGRGATGAFGAAYGLHRECEDVQALLEHTSARDVFGLSSGAVIALAAACRVPGIRRVAAYEPPLSIAGHDLASFVTRFDREIAAGKPAAAMLTVLKNVGELSWLRWCPPVMLTPLIEAGMRLEKLGLADGDVSIRELVPTMHYDAQLIREATAMVEQIYALRLPILLLGGDRSARFLTRVLDVLDPRLARATRIKLNNVGHTAPDNDGSPELVADALRKFFKNG
jgi:pimeloyl-ACP methyl ester carboxylesterase